MTIRFGLLGEVAAWIDGRPVELGHSRQRSVLAVLLVAPNTTVTVDELVDRVWADRPPQRARDTLYGYLHRLRRALAGTQDVAITRSSGGYLFAGDPLAVDVHRFAQLLAEARAARDDEQRRLTLFDEALGLWRGREACVGLDAPWLDTWRRGLHQQRRAAELDRADVALRLGRHNELLADLSTRAAEYPLDERLAGQLMLALYRGGRLAEALEHYRSTRLLLAEELGTDPGSGLQRLNEQILTSDPALTVPATADRPGPAVPRQLPMPPSSFTGRGNELTQLDKTLDVVSGSDGTGGTVVISAIGGAGGMGKTWLALHWAHRQLDQFPDGQLYVNLRGYDPSGEPVSPWLALHSFLQALGVDPAAIPGDLDARSSLYRSLVAGRRMLVVLDNAVDAAQVTPLLPGRAACVVLITSRSRLASLTITHGARPLTLDALTGTEARQLLVDLLGSDRVAGEPDAVAAIAEHCAGLPLALGILAARAASQPPFPLTVLADELSQTSTRLDALDVGDLSVNLRAVFSCSFRALPAPVAQACRLLGVAPGPDIGLHAAAALLGRPVAETLTLLRPAVTAHLIQEHRPGRYRMHDLLRLYAAEQAEQTDPETVRRAALRRMVDFYLSTAHAGARLLQAHREEIDVEPGDGAIPVHPLADRAAALAWFDTEHSCLLLAQQVAVRQHWHTQTWQLAWTLAPFHWRQGHRDHDHTVWQAGLAATQQLADPAAEAQAYRRLGDACLRLGRTAEAKEHLHQALALFEKTNNVLGRVHAHLALAMTWIQQDDHEQALAHAIQTLSLVHFLDSPVWESDALNAVGWCHAQLGHHEQAIAYCQRALALSRRHGYRESEAATLDSLGYIARSTGEHASALDYYRQVLTVRQELGDTYEEADLLACLGDINAELGRQLPAQQAWKQAITLYRAQHRLPQAEAVQHRLDGG